MKISVGIDAAKVTHWAVAVDADGRVVLDHAVENDGQAIDEVVSELRALDGEVVIGLDVVGSFVRFLKATLLAEGFALVHTPGIAVNRAGQGFAGGSAMSDPRDARTIADLVCAHDLRPILPDDDAFVAIRLKVGRRRELIQDQTRRISRLRGLLCGIFPGLERALDVACKGPLALLTRYVTSAELRCAGKARLRAHLRKTPHLHGVDALACRALDAARAQKIAVPGEAPTAELIRDLAASPMSLGPLARHRRPLDTRAKIARIDRDLGGLLTDHPDGALIRSLPGMGEVLAAEFLACVCDIRRFRSADALASAAGLAPVQRWSGKRAGWRRAYGGDKALKRVFYQSAFCAVSTNDPLSKAFYDRKRREGKHHTQALIALVRRRVTVIWTMLQRREAFNPDKKAA
ncbi:MAG: IS110 family transposase [Loktanella sp.]|nr:IS110 family transposase [Loktanella sp.]